ncbi:AAA family ATPase [Ohessyouella blattaphilus]|uniref:Nuclease SbcCD subunit C n=1 Tax=Ohessyouella blattaphilus TaxID=2949333 RepID=A0ABT1EJK5_9FIRM|nr:AAA family ATPase [Ohessyouella blattaphilus]MCP1110887.1 AAA family ATPase [Ohessyouella blattaphilus]MCR8564281.1 AAA family ATPase [Ohessyouella blattaphilus]
MKIKTIEYENFRNFKDYGKIKCSTDGRLTVVYGKNGDGKTTLHQLFQWVFYGQIKFNKTTTDTLYNLALNDEKNYEDRFDVWGRIEFEHDGSNYSLTRTHTYKKGIDSTDKISEDFSLQKEDNEFNWKRVDRPNEAVERMLPSGLAEYFFFDGESMIADLRVKGRDSASKLRKAIYSMFDLDIVESALGHIGKADLKSTVIGKLYISKGTTVSSGSDISSKMTNIEMSQNKIEKAKEDIAKEENERKKQKQTINEISEKIGSTKSKEEYEEKRQKYVKERDAFIEKTKEDMQAFGNTIIEKYPQIIISKVVNDAKNKLKLKVDSERLPEGVNKRLITYLSSMNTKKCICGNTLGVAERSRIKRYQEMLPPLSYSSTYQDFKKTVERWKTDYDKDELESKIRAVISDQEFAHNRDRDIINLDEEEKKSGDIEDLIIARQEATDKVTELDESLSARKGLLDKLNLFLKQEMKKFDELTEKNEASQKASAKIEIMELVAQVFTNKLNIAAEEYSKKLQGTIQNLLDVMLTSKRKVSVSSDFTVRVTDSYNDESKSEGQFAVVSFAYIGGILKMIRENEDLKEKEFPLVLDGPFSKLDADQRQNVVDMLPELASQVIVFSKDDLHDVLKEDYVGNIYTITSNEEKNIAQVEEGKLWT